MDAKTITKLIREVANTKAKLIEKAKTKGIYENFGQTEVRKISDKYSVNTDYSEHWKVAQCVIKDFSNWCSSYSL